MRCELCLTSLLLLLAGGCAHWSDEEVKPFQLPSSRPSPNSVGLEIVFVRVPPGQPAGWDEAQIWSDVDELKLPADLRSRLSANGVRCGLIGSQVPDALRRMLDRQQPSAVEQAVAFSQDGVSFQRRFLQSRSAQRNRVVASKTVEQLNVLLDDNGYHRGRTFRTARCAFTLKTFPNGDGSVTLELVPQIEHGQPLQRWIGQEGSFELETGLQHKAFDDLRVQMVLSAGESLLLASTPQIRGLGAHFFGEETEQGYERRMLLIRLAHTQLDDLFQPDQVHKPLVTPSL